MTALLLLRGLVAALEIEAELLKKATPEQVQQLVTDIRERRLKIEAKLERLKFWDRDDDGR